MEKQAIKLPGKTSEAREKILNKALELFYSQGIRATGIDRIIEDSEVAKMTFYKHFPSKQKLVLEVLRRGEEIWNEQFHAVVDKVKDPRQRLLAAFDFASHWFQDPHFRGCAYINTTVEACDAESEESRFAAEHKKKLAQFFEKTSLEAGFDSKTSKGLGKTLLLLMDGAIVRALMEKSPESAKTARKMAELLIADA
jgi:AcrR family transcriptional regulator